MDKYLIFLLQENKQFKQKLEKLGSVHEIDNHHYILTSCCEEEISFSDIFNITNEKLLVFEIGDCDGNDRSVYEPIFNFLYITKITKKKSIKNL